MTNEDDKHDIEALAKNFCINIDVERTSTSNYLTAQEHRLFGSSSGPKYYEKPHTPLAVIDDIATVEECEVIRRRVAVLQVHPANYEKGDIKQLYGNALLPPLDIDPNSLTYGQTLHDPELLNLECFPNMTERELLVRGKPFPFRRT